MWRLLTSRSFRSAAVAASIAIAFQCAAESSSPSALPTVSLVPRAAASPVGCSAADAAADASRPAAARAEPSTGASDASQSQQPPVPPPASAAASLGAALAQSGMRVDLERGVLGLACNIDITRDLIEYLLVGPAGSAHESLLSTAAQPSLINAGLLLLGLERGRDARWVRRDPPPSEAEREAGVKPFTLELPRGDGFYLYLGWRRDDETLLFRVEDLLVNLRSDSSMKRHRWVYTGSRFVRSAADGAEVYAADLDQNLISVVFFPEGNVFATAALPDCANQTNWIANSSLVPRPGSAVELFFSKQRIVELPPGWAEKLPSLRDADAVESPNGAVAADAPVPSQGGQR